MRLSLVDLPAHDIPAPSANQSPASIRVTAVQTYLACPRRYRLQYIDGLHGQTSPAAALGTCVHRAVEVLHAGVPLDDAVATLRAQWASHRIDDPVALEDLLAAEREWLPWYDQWRQGQRDIAVEEGFSVPLPGLDWHLVGHIDRIYLQDGRIVISDIKSGRTRPDVRRDLQLSLYSWLFRQSSDQQDDYQEVVHLRTRKAVRTARTDDYLERVIEQVVAPVVEAIDAGIFPANPDSRYGCGYCDLSQYCTIGGESNE